MQQCICVLDFVPSYNQFIHIINHLYLSRLMRKPTICICENKDADQLRGNREADQHLCFRYTGSTIPLLPKYKMLSSVTVQSYLSRTWSETTLLVFPRGGSCHKKMFYFAVNMLCPLHCFVRCIMMCQLQS